MKKLNTISIFVCFIGSVLAVTALFLLSSNLTQKHNSFLRLFPPHPVFELDTFNIRYNSYYIAGVSDQNIYLGNHVVPNHVLILNSDKGDTVHQQINIIAPTDLKFGSLSLQVHSPHFFLFDGTLPAIFKGNVDDWQAYRLDKFDDAYFTDILAATSTSFFIRSLSSTTEQYVLGKEFVDEGETMLFFKPEILKKQIDGKFCVDGSISYNREVKKLIYTYYYRNQFFVMDSNLNVMYEGKTIDTISRAQIKISSVSNGRKQIMSTPPLMVNKRTCTSGNWLLIHSGLLAKNEDVEAFEKASVIDIYDIINGQYQFSFYIQDLMGEKMKFFYVNADKLIVLFEQHIMIYGITPKYLDIKNRMISE